MKLARVMPGLVAALAAALSAGAIQTASAASAGGSGGSGTVPTLRVGTTFPESTLDITKNTGAYVIDDLALDTLVNLGAQAQVEPGLATSVTQPNPLTYLYHLRHGVKFWDGDPLTATDVAYSLNYYRSWTSHIAYEFPAVKSIVADGAYTVVVSLPGPDPAWQYTPGLAGLGIFEAKFAQAHMSTFGQPGTLIMGSGPWEIDSLDPTSGAELSANPDWWGGTVRIQHISVKFFSSETSLALAFRAGEVDLDPNITDAQSFAATAGAKLLNAPSCQDGFFTMNTQTAPWSDIHVRRAVAYALDRANIITAAGGYASPLYTFIPPAALRTVGSQSQVDHLLSTINLYSYNLAKAKQEMAESAYPHRVKTTFWVPSGGTAVNVAQVIDAELQKIGIDAQLKVVTEAQQESNGTGPASDRSTYFWEGGCINPDVSGYDFYLGSWDLKQGQWNVANWAPPEVDKLLTTGSTTSNQGQRFTMFSQVVQQMSIDVPYVPLYLHDFSIAVSKNFRVPGYNYWYFLDDNYGLDIEPAS